MCTLIAAFQQHSLFPVIVAANRDELYARASSGPRDWEGGFFAPRDEVAFGTWLGVTSAGAFVGVTNRFGALKDAARESRGTLVVEALRRGSARLINAHMQSQPAKRFNAFHLLYFDAHDAFVSWSDGEVLRHQTLAPGVHVVTERSLGGDDKARTELIQARLREVSDFDEEQLMALMRTHAVDKSVGGICVHVPSFGYGTRSSAVLRIDQAAAVRFQWADGPPCENPYRLLKG